MYESGQVGKNYESMIPSYKHPIILLKRSSKKITLDIEVSTFYQYKGIENKTGTSGEKGTGLGLLICKEIIEAHSGKISVESVPGIKTCFKIEISNNERIGFVYENEIPNEFLNTWLHLTLI